jgi:hypothetical protein
MPSHAPLCKYLLMYVRVNGRNASCMFLCERNQTTNIQLCTEVVNTGNIDGRFSIQYVFEAHGENQDKSLKQQSSFTRTMMNTN